MPVVVGQVVIELGSKNCKVEKSSEVIAHLGLGLILQLRAALGANEIIHVQLNSNFMRFSQTTRLDGKSCGYLVDSCQAKLD